MAKQKKKSHKSASMVDLRKVHRADNAPDNPRANTMLRDGNIGENVTTSPHRSIRLRNENNDTEALAKDPERTCTGSQRGETLNKREEETSRRVEDENPDVDPVVESNLTSIRGSDERKSELTFAQEEYKDDNPILLDKEMEDDLDGSISDHSRRMRELESGARVAARHLQWAENQIKDERRMFHENVQARMAKKNKLRSSNRKRKDPSSEEDGQDQQSRLLDENIRRAVENINNPARHQEETQGEYNARLAARVRIQREEIHKAESKNHKRRLELKAEAKIVRQEEKEYERKKRSLKKRHSQDNVERHSLASRDTDMERTEHYREWLSSQNYLDSLREADIRETGRTNILSRTKRADYSRMPKHWCSAKAKKRQAEQ